MNDLRLPKIMGRAEVANNGIVMVSELNEVMLHALCPKHVVNDEKIGEINIVDPVINKDVFDGTPLVACHDAGGAEIVFSYLKQKKRVFACGKWPCKRSYEKFPGLKDYSILKH